MTEPLGSGETQQAPAPRPWPAKTVASLAIAAVLATASTLFAYGSRLTALETQRVGDVEARKTFEASTTKALDTIQVDLKKLLEGDK